MPRPMGISLRRRLRCFRCYCCPIGPVSSPRGCSTSGAADIFNAFYQANHAGLLAGQLGAAFFLPTLIVPLLLITHGLSFRILLQREDEPVTNRVRQTA